mmetsp:Transcript_35540/g.78876  ORF Transcript_35540/g.78876 Transcript_35540/m.78876 type:complete len:234 (-) Transcript_35540:449-1150(-)
MNVSSMAGISSSARVASTCRLTCTRLQSATESPPFSGALSSLGMSVVRLRTSTTHCSSCEGTTGATAVKVSHTRLLLGITKVLSDASPRVGVNPPLTRADPAREPPSPRQPMPNPIVSSWCTSRLASCRPRPCAYASRSRSASCSAERDRESWWNGDCAECESSSSQAPLGRRRSSSRAVSGDCVCRCSNATAAALSRDTSSGGVVDWLAVSLWLWFWLAMVAPLLAIHQCSF